LIRYPTKNPLKCGLACQMVIFAPSNRVLVDAFMKNLPPKSPHFEKKSVKIPLVIGGSRKFSYSYEFFNIRTEIQTQKGAIMIHDCIYQFLRLFYHSRFKPQQLEMTKTQFVAPVLDLVLVLPLILRLFKDFSRFSNATKMKIQSKPEING